MAVLEVLAVAGVARVGGHRGRLGVGGDLGRVHGVLAHGWFHSLVRPGVVRSGVRTVTARGSRVGAQTEEAASQRAREHAVAHVTERYFSQGPHRGPTGYTALV
ncbi:hypothetical protein GCM10010251_11790 [Streptomyces aurantiogriseus]|uniref:Uncharacterized protein n=1 Tax=Streptomyces aurantiogriseus TaxID=66870 RepID=A0A918F3P7_9ACTN|nr:hypothetical protein GCM10010251_11790 [Streptomyces aurantiogriseus]